MFLFLLLCLVLAAPATAQVSGNGSLNGTYAFRQVLLVTDGASNVSEMRSASGLLTFDGAGRFTIDGQQLVGTAPPAALTGAGSYTVKPGGYVTLTNPLRSSALLNARLGMGAVMGASTEAGPTLFDLLIAIPLPAQPVSNATLTGPYWVSTLEFPGASAASIRNTNSKLTANGSGAFAENAVTGQARNLGNRLLTQDVGPVTYSVSPNARGLLSFAATDVNGRLAAGLKEIFVSQDGSVFIGGSMTAGVHGLVVGVRAFASGATNASWNGFFFTAGMRFDADRSRFTAAAGAVNVTSAGAVWARRTRQSDGLFDASTLATYSLGADGSGPYLSTTGKVNVGASGQVFTSSGVSVVETASYELYFGARMPPQSGSGVFLHPQGVLNAASFAPPGAPVSPGGFVTLFGSGLAAQPADATAFPFPKTLGGVSVSVNGVAAPIYAVSPGQISAIIPYAVTGPTATIVVTSNGTPSNAVEVPLAVTAPGVFSLAQNGLGDAAVLHADYSVVNASNPARAGETVQVYLTGLGAVTPPVADGAAAPSTPPFATAVSPVAVTVGGRPCTVVFSGLAPTLAGLYQLNVTLPAGLPPGVHSLAVQTVEGFTDMVDLRVGL
jgi:uncharacterized protein (TIGR03437 family)